MRAFDLTIDWDVQVRIKEPLTWQLEMMVKEGYHISTFDLNLTAFCVVVNWFQR